MEVFKKQLRRRQTLLVTALLSTCSALLLTRFLSPVKRSIEGFFEGFIDGFQVGIVAALLGFSIAFIIQYARALRREDRLKKLYVTETDERNLYVHQRSGSVGMNAAMFCLAAATAIAGNFNETVFFTLLGATSFIALLRLTLKLYYKNKY